MSLHIAIFEDDKALADAMQELMELKNFTITCHYSLEDEDWHAVDLVLGDFRNEIVSFAALKEECERFGIPLIAISGMPTTHRPELIKPFSVEQVQAAILDALAAKLNTDGKKSPRKKSTGREKRGFLDKLVGWLGVD